MTSQQIQCGGSHARKTVTKATVTGGGDGRTRRVTTEEEMGVPGGWTSVCSRTWWQYRPTDEVRCFRMQHVNTLLDLQQCLQCFRICHQWLCRWILQLMTSNHSNKLVHTVGRSVGRSVGWGLTTLSAQIGYIVS